jgi:hypothetical protein
MWLSGSPETSTYWFGVGIVIYGFAIAGHGTAFVIRLFRRVRGGVTAV